MVWHLAIWITCSVHFNVNNIYIYVHYMDDWFSNQTIISSWLSRKPDSLPFWNSLNHQLQQGTCDPQNHIIRGHLGSTDSSTWLKQFLLPLLAASVTVWGKYRSRVWMSAVEVAWLSLSLSSLQVTEYLNLLNSLIQPIWLVNYAEF